MLYIVIAIIAIVIIYGVTIYNSLVNVKHSVAKAWANIDVLLTQRHDEIPKLVEVCKQYRQFEQETLEKVIRARSLVQDARQKQDVGALGPAETMLRSSLGTLFAVAEAYPELKTNENFMQLQSRISQLENSIADRRELYNEAVNINNVRIEQFPDTLVAKFGSFPPAKLLEFSEGEKRDVDMKALFG
ncbi:MAG TPA: LemA family protein [Burkholderiales bacterium]|nr:LemA family protein [Burkholderiales bacterium]